MERDPGKVEEIMSPRRQFLDRAIRFYGASFQLPEMREMAQQNIKSQAPALPCLASDLWVDVLQNAVALEAGRVVCLDVDADAISIVEIESCTEPDSRDGDGDPVHENTTAGMAIDLLQSLNTLHNGVLSFDAERLGQVSNLATI